MAIWREKDNFCVGCPQGCINCGRKDDVVLTYAECDDCGEEDLLENMPLYVGYNDKQLCKKCYVKDWLKYSSREELETLVTDLLDTNEIFDYLSDEAEEVKE